MANILALQDTILLGNVRDIVESGLSHQFNVKVLYVWHSRDFKKKGIQDFPILDVKESVLFIARDFFGIKPFYYAFVPGRGAFASEIKALTKLPFIFRHIAPQLIPLG